MVGFYRKLIPKFSEIVFPLSERMRLSPKGPFTLDKSERQSFNSVIKEPNDTSSLAHPEPNCTNYQLVTDSSNYAVSAALHQIAEGNPIPIGFFSKTLTQTQMRYSTFDRDLSVLHFRHHIEGRQVLLLTDHKPLCGAFYSLKTAESDRQQQQ